jgi:hypothetical protein
MSNNLTVFNLFHFTPLNEREKKIYAFDKITVNRFIFNLDKDAFYLGGHIKMKHNDVISLVSIQKAREINEKIICEYGSPRNSWDTASIYTAEKELEFIEKMIKAYYLIMDTREKEKNFYDYPYYY